MDESWFFLLNEKNKETGKSHPNFLEVRIPADLEGLGRNYDGRYEEVDGKAVYKLTCFGVAEDAMTAGVYMGMGYDNKGMVIDIWIDPVTKEYCFNDPYNVNIIIGDETPIPIYAHTKMHYENGWKKEEPKIEVNLSLDCKVKGFLPPRMTTADRNEITSPATGLSVYNTTTNEPEFYDGTTWKVKWVAVGMPGDGTVGIRASAPISKLSIIESENEEE